MNRENCWLQITAGRGPLECCRLVFKLIHEIKHQASKVDIEVKVLHSVSAAKPQTSRSVLLELAEPKDKGVLLPFARQWQGTIQWISQSPFRLRHKRKNWFAGVELLEPPVANSWSMKEIRIETMRASGPGGQHVNKTESAVRITHIPTGLSSIAREARSQQQNKKLALARLAAMLQNRDKEQVQNREQQRWQLHNELERGNPVKIFKGEQFIEN